MIILSFHCGQCGAIWDVKEKDLKGDFPNCSRGCDEGTAHLNDYRIKEDWIPVSEEPEKEGRYLVRNEIGEYHSGAWTKNAGWCDDGGDFEITHYRALPKPPKGES